MDLLGYDGEGASLHLNQRELLMLMALVQEGRASFECQSLTGQQLDHLISTASVMVESARREALGIKELRHSMGQVVVPSADDAKKIAH